MMEQSAQTGRYRIEVDDRQVAASDWPADVLADLVRQGPAGYLRLYDAETGEIFEGRPAALAGRLLAKAGMDPLADVEDYCPECPHCHDGPTSVAVEFGDQGLQVVPAEPCEWCGYDFGMSLVGPDRHECRDEEHLAHGVGCVNCGACLHASHGGI